MIILAIAHRRELSGKWEWILVNGVIDLILAGIIISGLPGTLFWALGLLVGIDMVFRRRLAHRHRVGGAQRGDFHVTKTAFRSTETQHTRTIADQLSQELQGSPGQVDEEP